MKCKNCLNLFDHVDENNNPDGKWCPETCDSPDEKIERECNKFEAMTNADRIRHMTDGELAIFLNSKCPSCNELCEDSDSGCLEKCQHNYGVDIIFRWLKKEAK